MSLCNFAFSIGIVALPAVALPTLDFAVPTLSLSLSCPLDLLF